MGITSEPSLSSVPNPITSDQTNWMREGLMLLQTIATPEDSGQRRGERGKGREGGRQAGSEGTGWVSSRNFLGSFGASPSPLLHCSPHGVPIAANHCSAYCRKGMERVACPRIYRRERREPLWSTSHGTLDYGEFVDMGSGEQGIRGSTDWFLTLCWFVQHFLRLLVHHPAYPLPLPLLLLLLLLPPTPSNPSSRGATKC